jgi:NitT/TauT family transport system ATP-binding protein
MAPPRTPLVQDSLPRRHFSSTSPLEVRLPRASVDGLVRLVRVVADSGDRHDPAALADALRCELDDVRPLVQAAELLGFVEVVAGAVQLTASGRHWVAGTTPAQELFARAAYDRAPLVRAVVRALAATGDGTLDERFFVDLLRRGFTVEAARTQIDTAADWGRYCALFDVDASSRQLRIGRSGRDLTAAEKATAEKVARSARSA